MAKQMLVQAAAVLSLSLLSNSSDNMPKLPKIVSSLETCNSPEGETKQKQGPFSTHLVVHFDINETCLVGDVAGGDSREDSLNKIIAKSSFVKIPNGSTLRQLGKSMDDTDTAIVPTVWWNGKAIGEEQPPPPLYTGWNWPKDCCPYYRTAFKKRAKRFVTSDGKPYKELYAEIERLVSFNHPQEGLPDILFHLIPALFDSMRTLTTRPQPVSIVFRTFGSDLPDIAEAVAAFAQGRHPDFADFSHDKLVLTRDLLFRGRWNEETNVYELLEYDNEEKVVASGDDEIVKFLESKPICGVNDDYDYWAANGWEPWAGKPVWVPSGETSHHILLDDNIHNLPNDSIASVRVQQDDGTYKTLTGSEIQEMQGIHLIRVPTIEPILNRHWFVQQLDKAQGKFAS